MAQVKELTDFIRSLFDTEEFIPLHEPKFFGNEKEYLSDCIDSTFVSSVGKYVNKFEELMQDLTGAKYAIAAVNGTNALQMALQVSGVEPDTEVITQALSFVATANAIKYCNANPVFIDVDRETMGLSPIALKDFLKENGRKREGGTYNKTSGKKISACVPMHTYGFPCKIDLIKEICQEWDIPLVEDSAESLGSYYKGEHTGRFGLMGIFSFNGNKTITSGGGGVIITDNEQLASKAKHLTTQAKVPHSWDFYHDEVGYNYRMPNINAALACAQLEQLNGFVDSKRELSNLYKENMNQFGVEYLSEQSDSKANYWLNTVLFSNRHERDEFLEYSNKNGVMTRPAWILLNNLPMYSSCETDSLENSQWLSDRIVNIPSSVRVS